MYLLKLALRPWRMAPLSQISAALAVGFLLILGGFLFWMQQGLKTVLVRLQGEQVVTAYLDSSVVRQDESKLVDTIRTSLGAPTSAEIKLVDAPQFIHILKNQYPDLGRELEELGDDMRQVVPRYVSVSGILPEAASEKIKNIPGIESVESSKDRYHHVVGAFLALRWIARVLMFGIVLALFSGLIHLSRMNSYLHREVLSLLRFWGAGNRVLMSPGMISGLLVGLLGGVFAWAGWMSLGVWLSHHIRSFSVMLKGMPPLHPSWSVFLFVAGSLIGFFAGLLGSIPPVQNSQSDLERGMSV